MARSAFAIVACVVGLGGMAYSHISDLGTKLEEHVYYMATLFICNITASIILIPLVLYSARLPRRWSQAVWGATGALAVLTIAGFLWSRVIGFPRLSDHVGDWDGLGLTSLGFEALVAIVSGSVLAGSLQGRTDAGALRSRTVAAVEGGN